LITLHRTKGQEFDHVFLTGMEDGIGCPHKPVDSMKRKGLREERRWLYVGMTPGEEDVDADRAGTGECFGKLSADAGGQRNSRFLEEIHERVGETCAGRFWRNWGDTAV